METIKFFVSYSHKDDIWVEGFHTTKNGMNLQIDFITDLEKSIRLSLKQHNYEVGFWKDTALNEEPGVEFTNRIRSEIDQVDFAILLLSTNFLTSDFIRNVEMPLIKERLDQGKLKIIPIMVGKVNWDVAPDLSWLQGRQMILNNTPLNKTIETLGDWDEAQNKVLAGALSLIHKFTGSKKKTDVVPPYPGINPDITRPEVGANPKITTPMPKSKQWLARWMMIPLAIGAIMALLYWGIFHAKEKIPNVNDSIAQGQTDTLKDSSPQSSLKRETEKPAATPPALPPQQWSNSVGMTFVKIPAGTFTMGSTSNQADDLAKPAHQVQFTKPFYIGKYEVTQKEWTAVMGAGIRDQYCRGQKPRQFRGIGDRYPMYYISYQDILLFIQRLNEREKTSAYRLPTETEWEYAARSGSSQDGPANLEIYSWFGEDIGEGAMHMVGLKKANPWGAHDMLGNAAELIYNFSSQYSATKRIDPQPGDEDGNNYCLRGGSFADELHLCQFSTRVLMSGNSSSSYDGFRLLKEIK